MPYKLAEGGCVPKRSGYRPLLNDGEILGIAFGDVFLDEGVKGDSSVKRVSDKCEFEIIVVNIISDYLPDDCCGSVFPKAKSRSIEVLQALTEDSTP